MNNKSNIPKERNTSIKKDDSRTMSGNKENKIVATKGRQSSTTDKKPSRRKKADHKPRREDLPEEKSSLEELLNLSMYSNELIEKDEFGAEISHKSKVFEAERIAAREEFELLKAKYILSREESINHTEDSNKDKEETIGKVYVLDTNIILNDANNLHVISQNGNNIIVLPETVIDEIDSKKSGLDEINFQAREFARILSEAKVDKYKERDEGTVVSVLIKGLKIDIISLKKYEVSGLDKSIINDRKIILVAKFAKEYYKEKEVKLLSLDVMCRIRAIGFNVDTDSLSYSKNEMDLEFIKRMNMEEREISGNIFDIDKDHKDENFCYIFEKKDENIHAVIKNGKPTIFDMSFFTKGDIKPRNSGQMFAMYGMLDDDFNIVLIEALAGSGKTLLALAAGMKNLDQRRHDKIIYIRNSIESVDKGEDIGYLSGNDEKMKIYNYPLYDTLDFIARAKPGKKTDTEKDIEAKVKSLIEKYKIETMWIGAIRGRTISNSYVIIDEIQNFSRKSLQTVLSRLDSTCKVVCIGSNRQIDNSFINKYTNGLSVLLECSTKINKEVSIFATRLDKVERGAITEWTERVFTK